MTWRHVSEGSVPEVSFERLRAEREQKVEALMQETGLDVLIAIAGGSKGQRGTVRFLSNYATNSQWSAVVWARGSSPRLLLSYYGFLSDAEFMTWIPDVQADPDMPSGIVRYLTEQGATHGKVGWAGPPVLVQALRSGVEALSLSATHVSVQVPFAQMTASKTSEELKLVRRVAAIADEILRQVQKELRPGIKDRDLVALAEYTGRRMGTTSGGAVEMSRGTAMAGPVLLDQPLESGNVIQFSVEPEGPGGYWAQTVRMYALGEPPQAVREWVNKGLEAETAGALQLKEGCSAAEVARTMLAATGQTEAELAFQLGHGIGLDMAEPPKITTQSAEVLRQNMTIVIHPSGRDERAGMFFGDTFLIGKTGAERLSGLPLGLIVV